MRPLLLRCLFGLALFVGLQHPVVERAFLRAFRGALALTLSAFETTRGVDLAAVPPEDGNRDRGDTFVFLNAKFHQVGTAADMQSLRNRWQRGGRTYLLPVPDDHPLRPRGDTFLFLDRKLVVRAGFMSFPALALYLSLACLTRLALRRKLIGLAAGGLALVVVGIARVVVSVIAADLQDPSRVFAFDSDHANRFARLARLAVDPSLNLLVPIVLWYLLVVIPSGGHRRLVDELQARIAAAQGR
jgi:hypothetical protein